MTQPLHPWPPPEGVHASGCIEALAADGWHRVLFYHYCDGRGSLWGHHEARGPTLHPEYTAWRWLGPVVPTPEQQGTAYLVWGYYDAPGELQALSRHGGDEDWLALCPAGADADPAWARDGGGFGCCSVSSHPLQDGRTVLIGAHA